MRGVCSLGTPTVILHKDTVNVIIIVIIIIIIIMTSSGNTAKGQSTAKLTTPTAFTRKMVAESRNSKN